MAPREAYEFGEFTLDVSERRLSKGGRPVSLEPKAHEVLLALVRNAGRLLTKRELLDLVWPESFVEEGILAVHVSGLRKALGQAGQPYIETVSRAGYRFTASVTQRPAYGGTPWLSSFGVPPAIRPEVYELIGRGRSHLLKASMFEVPQAVAAFRTAVELDPAYARPTRAWPWRAAHRQNCVSCLPPKPTTRPDQRLSARWPWMMPAPMRRWRSAPYCFSANGTGRARKGA
jgi:DNA-binding winged helix-turn-helix (wHTH) protein